MYYHANRTFMSLWMQIPFLVSREDCIRLLNVIDDERQDRTLSGFEEAALDSALRNLAFNRGIDLQGGDPV